MAKTPRLGVTQARVLEALAMHHGRYYRGCGWAWSTYAQTEKLLNSMTKHGLVAVVKEPTVALRGHVAGHKSVWQLTEAGRMLILDRLTRQWAQLDSERARRGIQAKIDEVRALNIMTPHEAAWAVAVERGMNISREDIRLILDAVQKAGGIERGELDAHD